LLRGWLEPGGAQLCERLGLDPADRLARTGSLEPAARANAHRLVDGFLDRVAASAG
jgi:hypothetical protein